MKKTVFLVAVMFFVVACATTSPPPTGGITADTPTLVVGSRFVFRETNVIKKSGSTFTLVVEKRDLYNNKPAYWIRIDTGIGDKAKVGDTYDIYDMELSWMATIRKGKETATAQPCIRWFNWP